MQNIGFFPQIIASSSRKTISIQVYRDCTVKIRVPVGLSQQKINDIITKKESWINKKIQHFQQNQKEATSKKEYIDGEVFYCLGKPCKIRINEVNKKNSIEFNESIIIINKTPKRNTKNILAKWFLELAKQTFTSRLKINFEIFSKQYQFPFPTLQIKKMKSRWGSMSSRGNMVLNKNLIHTPIECIDYVIMHELCHLKHKNHSKRFHKLQEKFTPNCKEIKKRLKEFNSEISSL